MVRTASYFSCQQRVRSQRLVSLSLKQALTQMADSQSLVDLVLDDVVEAVRLGRPVLAHAALQGHDNVMRYLLRRISSSNPSPEHPELSKALSAAFLGAAKQGHSRCLAAVVESSSSFLSIDHLMNARDELGDTALMGVMVAAGDGRGECAKILLQHNPEAQVAATNKSQNTALIWAAQYGRAECVRQLLQHSPGTQVAAANKEGNTALIMAAWGGHGECVSQILQHSPGTQVAAANEEGNTALIMAAWGGHAECVSQLLQHSPGTQVAAANEEGNTALILASQHGYAECVSQLLQHSPEAQVLATDGDGEIALLSAIYYNRPRCVVLLLAHSPSAQIATLDGDGQSVVETAAQLGHPQCLDQLLAHDPQPQHLDAAWLAALRQWDAMHARTSPHTQCLERLLSKGALLPASAQEADKAKNRLFVQDFGSRSLVADRANEAIVGLAMSVRGKKRKAGQEEEEK